MAAGVFLTGGSGFVGTAVLRELIDRVHSVNALVDHRNLQNAESNVNQVKGSLFDQEALERGMSGCAAVIHLVGIIMERKSRGVTFQRIHFEGTKAVVDAAKAAGIGRFIHMSALGSRPDAVSTYHKTKYAAEQYVEHSGLEWTIFRPSLIHGPRGEFMQMEARWARRTAPPFLFMPYFGAGLMGRKGAGMLQPVHVDDVARALVDAVENRKTIGEIYLLAGPDQLAWPQLHRTVSRNVVGKERMTMPMPVWAAKLYCAIGVAKLLGFNRDQVVMSQEQNTADITKFVNDFGWTPRGFEASLKPYARQL